MKGIPKVPGIRNFRAYVGLGLFAAVLPAAVVRLFNLVEPYALPIVLVVLGITGIKYAFHRLRR